MLLFQGLIVVYLVAVVLLVRRQIYQVKDYLIWCPVAIIVLWSGETKICKLTPICVSAICQYFEFEFNILQVTEDEAEFEDRVVMTDEEGRTRHVIIPDPRGVIGAPITPLTYSFFSLSIFFFILSFFFILYSYHYDWWRGANKAW